MMGEGGQDAEIVLRRGTRLNRLKGQELSKSVTASGWTPKRSERLTSIVSTFSLSSLPFREVGLGIIKFGHPCTPDRTVSRQQEGNRTTGQDRIQHLSTTFAQRGARWSNRRLSLPVLSGCRECDNSCPSSCPNK